MRLTNFGSVVSTYKKNFDLRKKKFIDNRKKIIDEKRKEREDQIEAVKAVEPLIKKINFGKGSKSNFLGGIQRFLGFALAGLIVSNLKNIIPIISEIFKKTEEILRGIGKFVSGTIGGLQSFYDASTEKIAELNKYIEDFRGIDQSEFKKFETESDKLGRGALAIAGVLSSAKFITDILGLGKKSGSGAGGTGPAGKKGRTTTPPPRRETSVRSRSRVRTPAPVRTPALVRTPVVTPVATPTPKPTAVPTQQRVLVDERVLVGAGKGTGTGTGTGTGAGKGKPPYFGDLISRTAPAEKLMDDTFRNMLDSFSTQLTAETAEEFKNLQKTADDFSKIKTPDDLSKLVDKTSRQDFKKFYDALLKMKESGAPPTALEEYLRQMQDQGIRASDELIGAAGDAAAVRAGALPDNELVGIVEKFDDAMVAKTRLKADLRSQGIKVDNVGDKVFKEVFEDYSQQLRRQRLEGFLNRSPTSTRTPAQRAATGRMMGKIINFLRFLGVTLGIVSLVLLAKEVGEDYQRGDIKSVIVKLTAAGFGAAASALAYTVGMGLAVTDEYVTGSGVGLVKGGAIVAGAAGIGIGVEEGIRRTFLGGKDQSASKPSSSLLPPLPPTNTLPGGVQSYGAPRAGGTRKHAGVDFDPANDNNSKFHSRIGGEVIFAGNVGGGYGNVVDIYNKELGYTERIAEGDKIHVKVGDVVSPGTLVQSGSTMTGVFHYEIRKGKAGNSGSFEGTVNPLEFLKNLKPSEEVSVRTSASNKISTGLNGSTTYSEGGIALRREINNIIIPIAA